VKPASDPRTQIRPTTSPSSRTPTTTKGTPSHVASSNEPSVRGQPTGEGEYLLHDIENVGEDVLVFTTVEHVDSANPPLPLPS
jgi:hypothetical protein